MPAQIERQRAQLQDALVDCQFHLGGARLAAAADPDLLAALLPFLEGLGMETVAAVAFASTDDTQVDMHFEASERLVVYEIAPGRAELIRVGDVPKVEMHGTNRFLGVPVEEQRRTLADRLRKIPGLVRFYRLLFRYRRLLAPEAQAEAQSDRSEPYAPSRDEVGPPSDRPPEDKVVAKLEFLKDCAAEALAELQRVLADAPPPWLARLARAARLSAQCLERDLPGRARSDGPGELQSDLPDREPRARRRLGPVDRRARCRTGLFQYPYDGLPRRRDPRQPDHGPGPRHGTAPGARGLLADPAPAPGDRRSGRIALIEAHGLVEFRKHGDAAPLRPAARQWSVALQGDPRGGGCLSP